MTTRRTFTKLLAAIPVAGLLSTGAMAQDMRDIFRTTYRPRMRLTTAKVPFGSKR